MNGVWLTLDVLMAGAFIGATLVKSIKREEGPAIISGAIAGFYSLLVVVQGGRTLGWWT